MYAQVKKPEDGKSKAAASSVSRKKNNRSQDFWIADNRSKSRMANQSYRDILNSKIFSKNNVAQLRRISERDMDSLVNTTKEHIKKLVIETYEKCKGRDAEMDGIAESLTTFSGRGKRGEAIHKSSRNCTAAVMTDDDQMLLAFNTPKIKQTNEYMAMDDDKYTGTEEGVPWNMQGAKFEVIRPQKAGIHAECSLVDELYRREPESSFAPLGITQDCCMLCAAVMCVTGYAPATRGYHMKNVTNWACPDVVRNSPERLCSFLGEKVYNTIKTESENESEYNYNVDLLLRRLAQAHNNWDKVQLR